MRDYVLIYINGKRCQVSGADVFLNLANFLRNDPSLTGTKIVCAEGDCGACTVLRAYKPKQSEQLNYESINSCIAPIFSLDGASIVTVEGLVHEASMSPIQEAMMNHHGSQCGFCTPGFVCSLTALFEQKDHATEQTIKNYCTGNLCRCTGYRSIVEAAQHVDPKKILKLGERYQSQDMLDDMESHSRIPIKINHKGQRLLGPKKLKEALDLKKQDPDARLYAGGTDLGVQVNKKITELKDIIVLNGLDELQRVEETEQGYFIGAGISFTQLEKIFETSIPELSRLIRVFAAMQIKNSATVVGNIANASPIGDSMPALLALDCELEIQSSQGKRRLFLHELYSGYKVLNLKKDEIITGIYLKKPSPGSKLKLYKVAKRKDLDISTVSSAFYTELEKGVMTKVRVAYGGVAAYPLRITELENQLEGQTFDKDSFEKAMKMIPGLIKPLSDHRGSSRYRMDLAVNLMRRSFVESQSGDK